MENSRTLLIASGQGTLRRKDIQVFAGVPEVQQMYDLADGLVIDVFGKKKIKGKNINEWANTITDEELNSDTLIAQPLTIATEIGLLKHFRKFERGNTGYGHSIGEFAILNAVNSLSDENALGLSMLRGIYSSEATKGEPGKMAVLLNIPPDFIKKLKLGKRHGVDISTENSPDSVGISGYKDKVSAVVESVKEQYRRAKGLTKEQKENSPYAVALKIGDGFHSFLMEPAQKHLRVELDGVEFLVPTGLNYFANHTHDYEASPKKIKHGLVEQLVHKVNFWEDIGKLIADGHLRIVEVGTGHALVEELKRQRAKNNLPPALEVISAVEEIFGIAA